MMDNGVVLTQDQLDEACMALKAQMQTGMKFDSGKLDYTLLPWDGVEEVVKVLEFGAKKYARDNWKKVESQRYMAAAFRHLVAHSKGEINDSETGLSHLAHASCCVLFMLSLEKQNGTNS